jgi:prepilin peptidase CpaA
MHMTEYLSIAALTLLFTAAVYADFTTGKIPNKLTVPFIVLGLVMQSAAHGLYGLAQSLGGAGAVILLFMLFGNVTKVGGGDVKLMAAAGAITGVKLALWAMLLSAVAGGIIAVAVMIRYRMLLRSAGNMALNTFIATVARGGEGVSAGASGIKVRYSPAIALGTLAAFLWKGWKKSISDLRHNCVQYQASAWHLSTQFRAKFNFHIFHV